jgi:SAM-dependent methyltransferase
VTGENDLPLALRSDADLPGYWLNARIGKRVLRPGGVELTSRLLAAAGISSADVIELGPGLGKTAREISAMRPKSYVGVDDSPMSSAIVRNLVASGGGKVVVAKAADTGLATASADVVIAEAMLTMQGEKSKNAIIDEAFRLLRPSGRYAIHELGLVPDSLAQETKDDISRDLARSVKVNARPLTVQEWTELLTSSGFEINSIDRAPMALLRPARVIADEGLLGTMRIMRNLIVRGDARKRVIAMRRTFHRYRHALTAVAIVAVVPERTSEAQ